jgi:hypothetical protein
MEGDVSITMICTHVLKTAAGTRVAPLDGLASPGGPQ